MDSPSPLPLSRSNTPGEWALMQTLLLALVRGSDSRRPDGSFTARDMAVFFVEKGACTNEASAGQLLTKFCASQLIAPVPGVLDRAATPRWRVALEGPESGEGVHRECARLLEPWDDPVAFLEAMPERLEAESSAIELQAVVARRRRFPPPVPEEALERVLGFRPAEDSWAVLEALGVRRAGSGGGLLLDMEALFAQHVAVSRLASAEQAVSFLWRLLRLPGCRCYGKALSRLLSCLGLPLAEPRCAERFARLVSAAPYEADAQEDFCALVLPRYLASLAEPSSASSVAFVGDFVARLSERRRAVSDLTLQAVNDALVCENGERIRISPSRIDGEPAKLHRVEQLVVAEEFESNCVYIGPPPPLRRRPGACRHARAVTIGAFVLANLAMFLAVFGSGCARMDDFLAMAPAVIVVKAFAAVAILNSALLLVMVSRVGLTWLAHAWPGFLGVLSAHRWILLHAAAAVTMIAAGCVHAGIWLGSLLPAMFAAPTPQQVPRQFWYVLECVSPTQFVFMTVLGVTGLLLLLVCILLLVTTLPPVMRRNYQVFAVFHRIAFPIVGVLLLVHASHATGRPFPLIAVFFGPAVLWYLVEMAVRAWRMHHACAIVCHEAIPGNDCHHLVIETPPGWRLRYKPGNFVRLCVPSLSLLEWHPFSLVSRPEEPRVRLLVKSAGDWTRRLCQLLERGPLPLPCRLDGPFESPTRDAFRSLQAEVMVVFAAGVGVSLYAGQVAEWIGLGKRVDLTWIDREFLGLAFLRDELDRAFPGWREEGNLRVRVYCTRRPRAPLVAGAAQLLGMYQAEYGCNPVVGLPVHYGRPVFAEELLLLERRHQGLSFAVFCCGPKPFCDELEQAVGAAKQRRNAAWSFSPEMFSFAWSAK